MKTNKKIGNILFYKIFLGYLFLTLIFTGYFIYLEYSIAENRVIKDMNTIEKAFHGGLSNSIWHLDGKQINSSANAIKSIHGIVGVSIISVNNEVLAQKGTISSEDKRYNSFLFKQNKNIKYSDVLIKHTFKVINNELSYGEILANVTVYTSKNAIYSIIKESLISILVYAFILILILWLLFNYFANKLLTNPLNQIIKATKDLNAQEHKKITLDSPNKTELNLLIDTFNIMSKRIADSFKELSYQKVNLEHKVNSRTFELLEKNTKLVETVDELEIMHKELIQSQEIANTARKNAEEANREKSMLLANISHELKTPLNGISGLIYLSKLKVQDNEVRKNLSSIQDYSETLLRMINDLLDSSKTDSKQLEIEKTLFNLKDMLDSLNQLYKMQCSDKNIEFELHYDNDIPENLISDPVRLHQVITNLLNNAIKFTHQGKVRLNVEIQSSNEKQVKIKFIVKDDGIGIKEEELKNIFKAFYQTKESLNYYAGGSGLGLNISQKIVEQLNGIIWADSLIDKGSSFFVLLEFEIGTCEIKSIEHQSEDIKNISDNSNKKVLVVDDNKININVLSGILKSIGINCDTAINGLEALNLVKQTKYDIVLTDIKMPVMGGCELTKRIRKMYNQNELPIIAISANNKVECEMGHENCGINSYINKPINPDTFLKTLQEYINCNIIQTKAIEQNNIESNSTLDVKDALKRFVNNNELYIQALTDFIKVYGNSIGKIKELINSKNTNDLLNYLHTIKGISANLSAKEFSLITAKLHDTIKYGKEYESLLKQYENRLDELNKEVNVYLSKQEVEIEDDNLLNDKDEVLNRLLEYCKGHNTKAIHFFKEMSHKLKEDPFMCEIERDIFNYNFKKAKEKIVSYFENNNN